MELKRYLVQYRIDGKEYNKTTDSIEKAVDLLKTARQLTDNCGLYEARYALLMPSEIDYKYNKAKALKEAKNGK